jgi:hypothetical protein
VALAALLLTAGAGGQETPDDPWAPLGLIDLPTEVGRVRLDPALAEHRELVRESVVRGIGQFRRRSAETDRILDATDEIVDRALAMLGDTRDEDAREKAATMVRRIIVAARFDLAGPEELTIVVGRKEMVREHLRQGGTLPGFEYDPDTGKARYLFQDEFRFDDPRASKGFVLDLVLVGLDAIDELNTWHPTEAIEVRLDGIAVHEFVELAVLDRIEPTKAHWRWFTDGLANAVTLRILRDVGAEGARELMLASLDVSRFEQWRGRCNLRYWPAVGYQIRSFVGFSSAESPLPEEVELTHARYAFAFEVVNGLIEQHGMESMRRALQAMREQAPIAPDRIIEILTRETGTDVAARLRAFQSFDTREEGQAAYTEAFRAARKERDYAAAVSALHRLFELDLSERVPVEKHMMVADYLAKGGNVAAGVAVYAHYIDRAAKMGEEAPDAAARDRAESARHELLMNLVRYSIRYDHPALGYDAARELKDAGVSDASIRHVLEHGRAGEEGDE